MNYSIASTRNEGITSEHPECMCLVYFLDDAWSLQDLFPTWENRAAQRYASGICIDLTRRSGEGHHERSFAAMIDALDLPWFLIVIDTTGLRNSIPFDVFLWKRQTGCRLGFVSSESLILVHSTRKRNVLLNRSFYVDRCILCSWSALSPTGWIYS